MRNATLSVVEHGPLRTYDFPTRYLKGAVYDDRSRLVVESQKVGLAGYPWVPADPSVYQGKKVRRRLEGRWLYGGHWIQHFGHFMIETITTLWPEAGEIDGIVFHKYLRRPWSVEPWQARTLDLLGLGDLPIHVVGGGRPVGVEELVVPSRSIVPDGWAHPQARAVWTRIRQQFVDPNSPERVFLSRTRFHQELRRKDSPRRPRTSAARDRALDSLFASHGFEVVHPETLPIDEQFTVFSNARMLAGCAGSALHMSAFAPDGSQVLQIGDTRSAEPMKMQDLIDAACGHRTCFYPGDTPVELLDSELSTCDPGS